MENKRKRAQKRTKSGKFLPPICCFLACRASDCRLLCAHPSSTLRAGTHFRQRQTVIFITCRHSAAKTAFHYDHERFELPPLLSTAHSQTRHLPTFSRQSECDFCPVFHAQQQIRQSRGRHTLKFFVDRTECCVAFFVLEMLRVGCTFVSVAMFITFTACTSMHNLRTASLASPALCQCFIQFAEMRRNESKMGVFLIDSTITKFRCTLASSFPPDSKQSIRSSASDDPQHASQLNCSL